MFLSRFSISHHTSHAGARDLVSPILHLIHPHPLYSSTPHWNQLYGLSAFTTHTTRKNYKNYCLSVSHPSSDRQRRLHLQSPHRLTRQSHYTLARPQVHSHAFPCQVTPALLWPLHYLSLCLRACRSLHRLYEIVLWTIEFC